MLQEYDNVDINEDILRIFLSVVDWFVVHGVLRYGVLHPLTHLNIVQPLVAFRLAFCIVPRLAICLAFWDGGVRSAYVYVYVPTQTQKKVILNLLQLFDLSDVLITVLRQVSIGVR